MQYKDGVITAMNIFRNGKLESVTYSEKMQFANVIIDEVVRKKTGKDAVITSILDGKHMNGSKHYIGDACDIRTRNWDNDTIDFITKELRSELGDDYDVIFEGDHIHVEYDPK